MDGEGNAMVPLGSDETAGDEDDEESSSSPRAEVNLQAELDNFRARWRNELTTGPGLSHGVKQRRKRQDSESDDDFSQDLEERARRLFLKGVSAEQDGNLYEAVKFYKQAIQLVPDIESRITDYTEWKSADDSDSSDEDEEDLSSPDMEDADLLSQFHRLTVASGGWCQPELPIRQTHISALPTELLTYICRWVVSGDLDMRSLERVALVCRGFYVCARDSEIWRQACLRVWGINCGSPAQYGSWRDMYINRPHLRYDGVYISKTSYVRPGEQGLDAFYRPFHMVEYYRYMRFFPDGTVLLLTSADEPYGVVPKLRTKAASVTGLYTGHYRLQGDKMAAYVKKRNPFEQNQYYRYTRGYLKSRDAVPQTEQSFHLEMRLADAGHRKNAKLTWLHYSCQILNKRTRSTSVTEFELDKKYPALIFSRVKSYTAASESPL